jgi:thiamine-monophosphate kinase
VISSGEFARIAVLRRRAARRSAFVVLGIGDDAALLRPTPGHEIAVSTDLLVEGIHFRLDWTTLALLGRKALAVSLSDMAAVGAAPRAALLSIAAPAAFADESLSNLYDGALAIADVFGVTVAGGDLSSTSGPLTIDAVLVGEVEAGRALRRAGARAGDDLYVSGSLGTSARGLALLESGLRLEAAGGPERDALRAHLAPEPRVALGRALLERRLATAAIDLSDGLSSDVRHLCDESGTGVAIFAGALPLGASLEEALHGGEQYELVFASPPAARPAIAELAAKLDLALTRIGVFGGPPAEVVLDVAGRLTALPRRGWDHFGGRRPGADAPGSG